MPIVYSGLPKERRVVTEFCFPTVFLRLNEYLFIPLRLLGWVMHFTALIVAAQGSDRMIRQSSLARGYHHSDYTFLRQSTNLCLAVSFMFLLFNLFGIISGRTLRFSLLNFFQGGCDLTAAVLLIVSWHAVAHVARIWHVFYVFSIIPTGFESWVLLWSFWRGVDVYQ